MKNVWILVLVFGSLLLHSCALFTSHKKFTIERKPEFSFSDRVCFSDEFNYSVFFYEDGSCLLVKAIDTKELNIYLDKIDYNIYRKWSGDQWFHWGVYQVRNETITLEFLEKVDQWGFMGMCRWKAILKNERAALTILPGPENRKIKELNYFPFPHTEISLQKNIALETIKIDPAQAWVNK
jgi:hypothetical protein